MEEARAEYKRAAVAEEHRLFDASSPGEQQAMLVKEDEALQAENIMELKRKTFGMQFLGTISHELRTPLNSLIGVIDLMQAEDMTGDQQIYIKTMEQSCTHLMTVIDRMQDLAALQSETSKTNVIPFDLVAVITGIADSLEHIHLGGAEVTRVDLDIDPRIPRTVTGDLTKVQQVIANLVAIATKASGEKRSSVSARFNSEEPGKAMISFMIKGLRVSEPGLLLEGLNAEYSLPDLFQPAATSNLSQTIILSREFLMQLESRLYLSVDPEDTLMFSFELRLTYDAKQALHEPLPVERTSSSPDDVRILIAEDNLVNQAILKKMLGKLGFKNVHLAENGKIAVEKLMVSLYDIIFMDCDMPVLNGYDATEHIRKVMGYTNITIVALTANSTHEAKQRCVQMGMDDYFTKPVTMKTLSNMLNKWMLKPHTSEVLSRM